MTKSEQSQLAGILDNLVSRRIIREYTRTSWSNGCSEGEPIHYAFRVHSNKLAESIILASPFDEDFVLGVLATAEAREKHGPAIESTLFQLREGLTKEVAKLYRLQLKGVVAPVPSEIIVKDVKFVLT